MPDPTSVSNAALGELGATLISDFEEGTSQALLCRTHFEDARDAALEMYAWKFATFYKALTPAGITPAFRWLYQYAYPTDPYCLTILGTDKGTGTRWEAGADPVLGRVVFSNEPSLSIAYIGRVQNLNQWSTLAIQTLIKVLASKLAKAITGQSALEQQLLSEGLAFAQAAQAQQEGQTGFDQFPATYRTGGEQFSRTPTWVAQRALGELGQDPLTDIDEETTLAFHCRMQLDAARNELLERHPWNFAKKRAVLTVSDITPDFGWLYQFPLPMEVLTVLGTDQGNGVRFEVGEDPVDGRVLLSDAEAVSIEYIARQDNYDTWGALALDALVKILASKLAPILARGMPEPGGDASSAAFSAYLRKQAQMLEMGQRKWEEAQVMLEEARGRDGREGYPVQLRANTILTRSRHRWGGRILEGLLPGTSTEQP